MFLFNRTNEEGICLTAWRDNRTVVVASTCKGKDPVHSVSRFSRKERKRIALPCPDAIHHYNATMGGVDLSDANVARCRSTIRGKKWYFPLFLYMLDLSVANAWILFRLSGSTMDLASFRASVADCLLRCHRKSRASALCTPTTARFDRFDHLVKYMEKQSRCAICSKCTNFFCPKCSKFLHPKNCFESFHTK